MWYFNVFSIFETKVDDSFTQGQFFIDGIHPSGLTNLKMIVRFCYISARIYQQKASIVILLKPKVFLLELIFIRKKWLINCSYNPHKNDICSHLKTVTETLDAHYPKYENIIFLWGFHAGTPDTHMTLFCELYSLTNLRKQHTFLKVLRNLVVFI